MSLLISDLLAYSRVSTHRKAFQQVALSTILKEVTDDLDVAIRETHAKLIINQLPELTGDPSQLRQLFQNLIANSLTFRRTGIVPVIRISCRQIQGIDLPILLRPTQNA